MDTQRYNACNATFRSLTDQQQLMVNSVAAHIGPGDELGLTSYGCGIGMFELALIEQLDRSSVWFQGVDTNPDAVALLRTELTAKPKVRGSDVVTASMADIADGRFVPTEIGLFVQSIAYLGAEEGMGVVKEAGNRHRRLFLAVPPLNELNEAFAAELKASGVERPLFAETLAEELNRFGVDFAREVIEARIRVRDTETPERLAEFLQFARHRPCQEGLTIDGLLAEIAGMSCDDPDADDGVLTVAHPVEVFSIG